MIKISADATAVRLIVDEVATLLLKIGNDSYVDFPIYDESFPLVKAGKKFRLTLEEVEMEEVGSLLKGKPASEASQVQEKYIKWDRYDKPSDNSAKTDPLLFGKDFTTIPMDMSNPPQPEELRPMSDEEVTEFIKTRSECQEELAQEYQGSFDEVSKGPFCDGCKHIGVNPESGPCAVCFEGMMHESDKAVTMENEVNPDESVDKDTVEDSNLIKVVDEPVLSDTQYNARKRKCWKCANSSNPIVCISCRDYSKFEPSRYR